MTKARDNATQGGLVLLTPGSTSSGTVGGSGGITFTNASSISINNVFSSIYDDYLIKLEISNGTGSDTLARLRSNGTDASGANTYRFGHIYLNTNSTVGNSNRSDYNTFNMVDFTTTSSSIDLQISAPFLQKPTYFRNDVWRTGDGLVIWNIGQHSLTNSYDGITIYPNSGSITGTIRIYGYKK